MLLDIVLVPSQMAYCAMSGINTHSLDDVMSNMYRWQTQAPDNNRAITWKNCVAILAPGDVYEVILAQQ